MSARIVLGIFAFLVNGTWIAGVASTRTAGALVMNPQFDLVQRTLSVDH